MSQIQTVNAQIEKIKSDFIKLITPFCLPIIEYLNKILTKINYDK
jgi:hypothetical protein